MKSGGILSCCAREDVGYCNSFIKAESVTAHEKSHRDHYGLFFAPALHVRSNGTLWKTKFLSRTLLESCSERRQRTERESTEIQSSL